MIMGFIIPYMKFSNYHFDIMSILVNMLLILDNLRKIIGTISQDIILVRINISLELNIIIHYQHMSDLDIILSLMKDMKV